MCLDAALRATQRERRLGDVHALECPQQKRLALPERQAPERALERRHRLRQLETPRRLRVGARSLGDRVRLLPLVLAAHGQPRHHPSAHRAPALHVANAVFEYAIEERLPLLRRPAGVGARELQHGVLHGIERVILVPQRRLCDLERLELDAGQELVQRARSRLGFRIGQVQVPV